MSVIRSRTSLPSGTNWPPNSIKTPHFFITATPLLNSTRDFLGYADMIWQQSWPFRFNPAERDNNTWEKIDLARLMSFGSAKWQNQNKTLGAGKRHDEYVTALKDQHIPLFLLNPKLVESFGDVVKCGIDFARMAVGRMMDILQIRQGMLDPLTLPDGQICHPGDGIPPIEVCRVELGMRADRRPVVRAVLSSLHENMMTPAMSKMAQHTGRGSVTGSSGMMIHPGMYRRAMLIGTDVRNQILTHPSVRCMKLLGDMEAMYNVMKPDGMHSDKGKKTVTTADVELGQPIESQGPLTSSQARKRAAEAEKRRPETAAGVAEMKRVALNDHTGGLHWYFYHTRPTDEFSFPSDRLEIMRYVVNKSPKYAFTLGMALRCQKTNERLLVIVNNPGYATRQSLEQQEPPQNFEREDAINRTQAPIDRRIEGEQLTICAFEIMATYLGQRCNRYPRKGAEWYEYDGQKMTDLGEFYSAIARTTILNPDLFSNMTPQFIRELAVS
ncbi:uncharacterized protein VDAG_08184 [Verticillium dahliae VdLs.17]|uniref:SNF2 N-terminal domain-containing protein n=1 Tax=Verticillium dahliae (strain VdLs.17 / ATCC MYA-4575 / FGSC 10137) TaxID=498257 RepID=G2XDF2_VERDV|nr:uncharacterized protein VDAG_08184 [Verticillium dahliae VdLs.17]EGY17020.1 hypothetical protein VDAG_08184 [Verticillium dahliae VdLs.17]KAH6696102.1 hypothetical protein EV126DRAFT_461705 [Verticillium dahliae]